MSHLQRCSETETTQTNTREEPDGANATDDSESTPTLQLRLEQPRDDRRVVFHEGVVDNEHLNRMKSKCCCIYKKPLEFGESSSEDDDECEHCFGHPEKRKKNKKPASSELNALHRDVNLPSTSTEAHSQPSERTPPAGAADKDLPAPTPDFDSTVKPSL